MVELPALQKIAPTTNKNIPIETILELKLKHTPPLSDRQIANLLGCSRPNITQRLAQYKEELTGLKPFKDNRADILAIVQSKLINSITADDIKDAGLKERVLSFGILYDKERLERGQSTENISIRVIDMSDVE